MDKFIRVTSPSFETIVNLSQVKIIKAEDNLLIFYYGEIKETVGFENPEDAKEALNEIAKLLNVCDSF